MATNIAPPSIQSRISSFRDGVLHPSTTTTSGLSATTSLSGEENGATDAAGTTAAAEPAAATTSGGASEGDSSTGDTASTVSDPLATASAATALTSPSQAAESSTNGGNAQGQNASEAHAQDSADGMPQGTKIGIGVGVGVGVAVILALIAVFFIMRRRRRKNRYTSPDTYNAEQMRGQPGMTSTEPALGGAAALGRSLSYRSNNRSSYHSLSPTEPPPLPHTAAMAERSTPEIETAKGTIPAQPTIIPPPQNSLALEPPENQTPRSRRSMEAEIVSSPGGVGSLASPAPPMYEDTPSPLEEHPERSVSPVSPVSSMGSRPASLRRSFSGRV